MSFRLTPCPACSRHVKATDCACPFCGAKVTCSPGRALPTARMSRAAVFAASALGTVLSTTDCAVAVHYGGIPADMDADLIDTDSSAPPPEDAGTTPIDASTDHGDSG